MAPEPIRVGGADYDRLVAAIRAAWSEHTSSDPARWSSERPAIGHCEVSSYVLWEHVGGELVTARVLVDGVHTEHHTWNRVDGADVDLTAEQFDGRAVFDVIAVLGDAELRDRPLRDLRPGLGERIASFRAAVAAQLTPDDTSSSGVTRGRPPQCP